MNKKWYRLRKRLLEILEVGDRVFIYTKMHLSDANNIEI